MAKLKMKMKKDAMRQLEIIEGFSRDWDPIGVMGDLHTENAADEYASYAPAIHSMLHRGCSVADLVVYWEEIQSEAMGISPMTDRDRAVAQQMLSWWMTVVPRMDS